MFAKYFLPIALAASTLMSAAGSEAMPLVKPSAAALPIESVGWRCGPGWHMNRWGRCVPNRRVIIRPMHVRHWHPGFWFHGRWHPGFWS